MLKCANFMNQDAIDVALEIANEDLIYIERSRGNKNPIPLYKKGTCCCLECDHGLNISTDPIIDYMTTVLGRPIKRVCYKASETVK